MVFQVLAQRRGWSRTQTVNMRAEKEKVWRSVLACGSFERQRPETVWRFRADREKHVGPSVMGERASSICG